MNNIPSIMIVNSNIKPGTNIITHIKRVRYPDKDLAIATSAALGHHMWYLSEQLVALAFFDDNVA